MFADGWKGHRGRCCVDRCHVEAEGGGHVAWSEEGEDHGKREKAEWDPSAGTN